MQFGHVHHRALLADKSGPYVHCRMKLLISIIAPAVMVTLLTGDAGAINRAPTNFS